MIDRQHAWHPARWCRALFILTAIFSFPAPLSAADSPALPMISSQGARLISSAGPVTLKGCNIGNLFVLESWMFGGTLQLNGHDFKDQAALFHTMVERFGQERTDRLMDVYRQSWCTPRDFDLIKSFGFNVVRLPFDYRALQDDAAPTELRPDAFAALDRFLKTAEDAGVYVILDMHAVPGGQSIQDHTGEKDKNQLWHDTASQDRTIALWKAVAGHYKDRSVIAAYDLINEPYSDMREDVRGPLAALLPRIADAIRGTGDKHVMFFPGALNGGIAFYGDPNAGGKTNIGFTEHYYPGLFGSRPAMETHARLLGSELPAKVAYLKQVNAPYLVGELNIVLQSEDPDRLLRMYYDRFAEYGWATTMWSYKLLKNDAGAQPSAWYMVTNADALPKIDAATASYDDLENFFQNLATAPLAVNEPLRAALTAPKADIVPLAHYASLPSEAPATPQSDPAGYTSADIGGAMAGHTVAAGDTIEILAGGSDINATHDSFRFVAQSAKNIADVQAVISSLTETNEYAKAGVMARWGDGAGAPMAMVNVFPDGTVALVSRAQADGPTSETKIDAGSSLPVQLRLRVDAGKASASYRTNQGDWKLAGSAAVPADADFKIGLAVCAHADTVLTTAKAILGPAGDAALPAPGDLTRRPAGESLLVNGSFEEVDPRVDHADQAAGWNRWGDWINRETSWSPTHEGTAMIGYHHWQIEGKGGSSGLWQDVKVQAGKRYTFMLFVQHDPADPGSHDADTLELRLEGAGQATPVTLNNRDFSIAKLATGTNWSRVSVSGTATTDTMRVLAVINASGDSRRGGAVKLDDATLTPATDGK